MGAPYLPKTETILATDCGYLKHVWIPSILYLAFNDKVSNVSIHIKRRVQENKQLCICDIVIGYIESVRIVSSLRDKLRVAWLVIMDWTRNWYVQEKVWQVQPELFSIASDENWWPSCRNSDDFDLLNNISYYNRKLQGIPSFYILSCALSSHSISQLLKLHKSKIHSAICKFPLI